jgi:hypothetical protein
MIDVNDHRRYAEGKLSESIKAAEVKVQSLVAQAPSDLANTGDQNLDKLVRAVQELINTTEQHDKQVLLAGLEQINQDALLAHRFEHFFVKGKIAAYKEIVLLPERIIAESKAVQLHAV